MRNCSEFNEMLSLYIDDQLDSEQRAELEAHIKECSICSKDLSELKQIVEWCSSLPEEELPPQFKLQLHEKLVKAGKEEAGKGRIIVLQRRIIKACASIAAVFLLAFLFRGYFGDMLFWGKMSSDGSGNMESAQDAGEISMARTREDALMFSRSKDDISETDVPMDTADQAVAFSIMFSEEKSAGHEEDERSGAPSRSGAIETQKAAPQFMLNSSDIVVNVADPGTEADNVREVAVQYGGIEQGPKGIAGAGGSADYGIAGGSINLIMSLPNEKLGDFEEALKNIYGSTEVQVGILEVINVEENRNDLINKIYELDRKISSNEKNGNVSNSDTLKELKNQRAQLQNELEELEKQTQNTVVLITLKKK